MKFSFSHTLSFFVQKKCKTVMCRVAMVKTPMNKGIWGCYL